MHKRYRRPSVALAVATALAITGLGAAPAFAAVTGDQGPVVLTTAVSNPPAHSKVEHRAWFAYGLWWSVLPTSVGTGYSIWKYTGTWTDTGVIVDTRAASGADALFNGTHLFVATHAFVTASTPLVAGAPSYLHRYLYNGTTWVADLATVTIQAWAIPQISIAQDSTGKLIVAFTRGNRPFVQFSTADADLTTLALGAAFIPNWAGTTPTQALATNLSADDNMAITSGGGATTILWSNQKVPGVGGTEARGFYSARHVDGASASTWVPSSITTGVYSTDSHISLASLSNGDVYAAVKTSNNDKLPTVGTDPQLQLLSYRSGAWGVTSITDVAHGGTRPSLVLDTAAHTARVFYAAPGDLTLISPSKESGTIYESDIDYTAPTNKTAADSIAIKDTAVDKISDPGTTHQTTGAHGTLVTSFQTASSTVVAHIYSTLIGSYTAAPGASVKAALSVVYSGLGLMTVDFTDAAPAGVTSRYWDFGDGTSSTGAGATANHTYSTPGIYKARLIDNSAGGASAASVQINAGVAPTAAFVAKDVSPTTLAVAVFDRSAGSIASYAWNFGDGKTSSAANPVHVYAKAGVFTVTLKVTNKFGSSTIAKKVTASTLPARVGRPTATALAGRKIRVGIPAVALNGGTLVTFTATCYSGNGGVTRTVSAKSRTITVGSLTTGKTYNCRALVVTNVGSGAISLASLPVKVKA